MYSYHIDVAEAAAFHKGTVEDVGVGRGAQEVVHVVAEGGCWRAGSSWVLGVRRGVAAHPHHKAAQQVIFSAIPLGCSSRRCSASRKSTSSLCTGADFASSEDEHARVSPLL